MRQGEQGMTLLEVVIAIAILMLGVGFIFKGNEAIQHYRAQAKIRQQMAFYAAGQLEILLHGGAAISGNGFTVSWPADDDGTGWPKVVDPANPYLKKIGVTVTYRDQQVTLYTYMVNW